MRITKHYGEMIAEADVNPWIITFRFLVPDPRMKQFHKMKRTPEWFGGIATDALHLYPSVVRHCGCSKEKDYIDFFASLVQVVDRLKARQSIANTL